LKIAVTADLHLTRPDRNPERFAALEEILRQIRARGIHMLIIAGDLFDKDSSDFRDFGTILASPAFSGLEIAVIPGNHDPSIVQKDFTHPHLHVYTSPEWKELQGGLNLLFMPFRPGATMAEALSEIGPERVRSSLLIGHGDYIQGASISRNAYEQGLYMPLTGHDIQRFGIPAVILGHVHAPARIGRLGIPGSPCPIDINETGRRSFLVFDTSSGDMEKVEIHTGPVFYNETFLAVPSADEIDNIRKAIRQRVEKWGLITGEAARVRIRIKVRGFVRTSAQEVAEAIRSELGQFQYYDFPGPDLTELRRAGDPQRELVLAEVLREVDSIRWREGPDEPSRDDIALEAIALVYEVKQ
jgi:DNA repair exonuclease SbcCD nuclease subunit